MAREFFKQVGLRRMIRRDLAPGIAWRALAIVMLLAFSPLAGWAAVSLRPPGQGRRRVDAGRWLVVGLLAGVGAAYYWLIAIPSLLAQ